MDPPWNFNPTGLRAGAPPREFGVVVKPPDENLIKQRLCRCDGFIPQERYVCQLIATRENFAPRTAEKLHVIQSAPEGAEELRRGLVGRMPSVGGAGNWAYFAYPQHFGLSLASSKDRTEPRVLLHRFGIGSPESVKSGRCLPVTWRDLHHRRFGWGATAWR